ncbi:putative Bracovirus protein MdBV-4-5 [Microplitis demolitor]
MCFKRDSLNLSQYDVLTPATNPAELMNLLLRDTVQIENQSNQNEPNKISKEISARELIITVSFVVIWTLVLLVLLLVNSYNTIIFVCFLISSLISIVGLIILKNYHFKKITLI